MSLEAKDLQRLSVSKLREYMKDLDGEDLKVAEAVLDSKLKRNEQIRDTPEVAGAVEASKDAEAEREAKIAAREEAKRLKEEEKAKIKAAREEAKAEREKQREEAKAAREAARAEREKIKAEREKEKEEKRLAREEAKAKREEERAKAKAEKEAKAAAKKEEEEARVKRVAAALQKMGETGEPKVTKTDQIRKLMMEGKTNRQIADELGFEIKFVCDNAWRIRKQIEAAVGKEALESEG